MSRERAGGRLDTPPLTVVSVRSRKVDTQALGRQLARSGIDCRVGTETGWSGLLLDTHDGALATGGLALARELEPARLWLAGPEGELRVQSWHGGGLPTVGPVGGRLRDTLGDARLIPHVMAAGRAVSLRLQSPGRPQTTLVLWRCTFSSPAEPRRRRTRHLLALPVGPEAVSWAAPLAEALRARRRPALPSLLAVGMGALRLPTPGAPLPAHLRVEPHDSLRLLAAKVLQRQAYQVRSNRFGTVHDLDPEYLHDLRVATRRARAALRMLAAVVPEATRLRADLAELGRLSGTARDLDVFAARLAHRLAEAGAVAAARAALLGTVELERRAARRRLSSVLGSPELEGLLARMEAASSPAGVDEEADQPDSAAQLAPRLALHELRRLRRWRHRLPDSLAVQELHAIRIAGKRARYALEFFAPVLDADVRGAIRHFVELQDCLGAHQDAVVAEARLAALAQVATRSPRELLALGAAIHLERQAQASERVRFAELAPELWLLASDLREHLKGRRPAPEPGDAAETGAPAPAAEPSLAATDTDRDTTRPRRRARRT